MSISVLYVWPSQDLFLTQSSWLRWSPCKQELCTQLQVRHHRLHAETVSCPFDDRVVFSFRRAQRRRRMCSRPFTTVPLIIIPPLVDLSRPVVQSESTCTSTLISSRFPCPASSFLLLSGMPCLVSTPLCRIRHPRAYYLRNVWHI